MTILEREITNVATLLESLRQVCKGFGRTAYWYRGHACAEWPIVPSVHRHFTNESERNLLGRFRLAAPTRYEKCPELHDVASWICLMQHYGLPTRLLDWTGSPLAAVFFAACYDPKPGPGVVWVLVPSEVNKASSHATENTLLIHGPEAHALLRAAFNGGPVCDDVIAVLGQDIDLRMTVQLGAFTLHGTDKPLEAREGAEHFLAKLVIPEDAKKTFTDELWVLGIHRSALFPDLTNLAAYLAADSPLIPRKDAF